MPHAVFPQKVFSSARLTKDAVQVVSHWRAMACVPTYKKVKQQQEK